jgi:hypothetical protein
MVQHRIGTMPLALVALALSLFAACSKDKTKIEPTASKPPGEQNQQQPSPSPATQTSPQAKAEPRAVAIGEASGTYTAKGETVQLKYAYAGRGLRFGKMSVIVLLTDKPIPPEALAEELKSQTLFYDEKIRGLEYVFESEGYWVRFHPSQYQESKGGTLSEYSVENDIVRGRDDNGSLTNGKYSRSVKFAALVTK